MPKLVFHVPVAVLMGVVGVALEKVLDVATSILTL